MEALNNIKTYLLQLDTFDDVETFSRLQEEVRNLIGQPGISIGITPFYFINNKFVFSAIHSVNSIFLKNLPDEEQKLKASEGLKNYFDDHQQPLVIPEITDETLLSYTFIEHLHHQGWKGIIFCPLRNYNKLMGVLEIVSDQPNLADEKIVNEIDVALPLFELAVNRARATLDAKIDKVIKEQFTAIQPSVDWRFTEAAYNFLLRQEEDEDAKMESILFDNVYPLYGSIDIRNSSIERNKAIQLDMLEQLDMVSSIIKKAQDETDFPLLGEIKFKIKKFKHSVHNIILSDEETAINLFLKQEVVDLFQQLKNIAPSVEEDIGKYFTAATSFVDMVYHHRKEFDESVTLINKAIAKFIDKEQEAAQKMYPHYFERFVTDGVDFNIYIGQSISPTIPFKDFYLRNLKVWQLTTLAKAAQLSNQLLNDIKVPLQTTQLLLAHNYPISISFRPAERKFDVEGAYNIRYELIKKRIDKVNIRDTNERLTQPGKIAIVYSQPKEGEEYLEYIEYLVAQGLLTDEIEQLELEELQGVVGLKAYRVGINVNVDKKTVSKLKSEAYKG
ncbi:MAG: hypothetical protein JNK79_18320 [Chitinophagaceae bacterium]|nr:hypothetical protein [Chitinophagaceae bacterium]